MNTFKAVRIIAKNHWLTESNRIRYINDNTIDSKECEWQSKFTLNDEHVSIFCSIGEWGSNLTDLLTDYRFDKYDFENENHRNALFRYYTRILLIASEILTDFQDVIKYLKNIDQEKARKYLSNSNLSLNFNQLMNYINNICKHKFGYANIDYKYHLCNHHIDYEFKDSKSFSYNPNNLSVYNLQVKDNSKVEVPNLVEILDQILFCYHKLDETLNDSSLSIKEKLKPFTKTYSA